jgi:hypothetical protein
MTSRRRSLAALELTLIAPAVVFLTAIFARNLSPVRVEPAASAQRIVAWFVTQKQLGLALISLLPLAVLVSGGLLLWRSWNRDGGFRDAVRQTVAAWQGNREEFLIALATVVAIPILVAVAIHVLTA